MSVKISYELRDKDGYVISSGDTPNRAISNYLKSHGVTSRQQRLDNIKDNCYIATMETSEVAVNHVDTSYFER